MSAMKHPTPNVLFPKGARERFPIPFREVKYLWSVVHKIFSDDFGASTAILTCPGRPALARNWEVLAS